MRWYHAAPLNINSTSTRILAGNYLLKRILVVHIISCGFSKCPTLGATSVKFIGHESAGSFDLLDLKRPTSIVS